VLSSNIEGMPNVLVEALQNGLPCIATECGAREILAPDSDPISDRTDQIDPAEYGVLVPVCGTGSTWEQNFGAEVPLSREERALSSAMKMLYMDENLCEKYHVLAAAAIKDVSLDAICGKWLQIMQQTIQGQMT
jgi:N-acetylgalactosamine-N,N'-diacetylbacillosaminyl-diphospho-undecaprenol 4-alpha-N-acetylgalactosaminyltransferase